MAAEKRHSNDYELIMEHDNPDFPLGVYYVEPNRMYLNKVISHWHCEIEIDLIREGTAIFHVEGKDVEATTGQAIYISPDHLHRISAAGRENCVILSLIFHPRLLFPNGESDSAQSYLHPLLKDSGSEFLLFDRSTPAGRGFLSYLEEIIFLNFEKNYGYELLTQSALCQLWMILIKDIKRYRSPSFMKQTDKIESPDVIRIKDALTFIQTNYAETISLDDIANSIHVSKSECCRCFKRAMTMSPFEYLMRYRILQGATQMLKDQRKEVTIAEIAFSVGFNNVSYFNKLFKNYLGCTPSEFRKKSKTEHRNMLSHFGLSLSHI